MGARQTDDAHAAFVRVGLQELYKALALRRRAALLQCQAPDDRGRLLGGDERE